MKKETFHIKITSTTKHGMARAAAFFALSDKENIFNSAPDTSMTSPQSIKNNDLFKTYKEIHMIF